jgi:tetratricopeptide (TPR) repeat protein
VWKGFLAEIRREPGGYLTTPYLSRRYFGSGVRFLATAGLQGNLFNPYHVGGYAGYWLAPRIRTFIDGRTEHYSRDVMHDYLRIKSASRKQEEGRAWALLDRRNVDIFLAAGVPEAYRDGLGTLDTVRSSPGWTLAYRTADHAIYLRLHARNRENVDRAIAYYAERGIRFDPIQGLDIVGVIRAAPDWAVGEGIIPESFAAFQADRGSSDPDVRFRALRKIAATYWLLDAFDAQIEADLGALALRPQAKGPLFRLANTYLRQGRLREAEQLARKLLQIDPDDPRAAALHGFAVEALGGEVSIPRALLM